MDLIYKQLCINVCVNRAYEHFTHEYLNRSYLTNNFLKCLRRRTQANNEALAFLQNLKARF